MTFTHSQCYTYTSWRGQHYHRHYCQIEQPLHPSAQPTVHKPTFAHRNKPSLKDTILGYTHRHLAGPPYCFFLFAFELGDASFSLAFFSSSSASSLSSSISLFSAYHCPA